jgi:photosystem II stability/assembly factor-like uncharacterized protein
VILLPSGTLCTGKYSGAAASGFFVIIQGTFVMASLRPSGLPVVLALMVSLPGLLSGQTWSGNGPFFKDIRAVAQSPGNSTLLWAGAFGWGIFRSTDGGTTWVNDRTGLSNAYMRSLVALSDSVVFGGTNDGVFKSTNGGRSWHTVLGTQHSVRALGYDAATSTLYAGTYGSGLFRSTNTGGSWSALPVVDPGSGQSLSHVRSIAVFGADSLFVGGSIGDIDSGGALFRTSDGGAHWLQVQPGVGVRSTVMSIAVSPVAPATTLLFGTAANGVYRSTNAGATWVSIDAFTTPHPLRDQHINAVAFSAGSYFAGTDSTGAIFSRTAGDTSVGWLPGAGVPGAPGVPWTLRVDRAAPARILAGLDGPGVYGSADGGATWQPSANGLLGTAARVIKINGNGTIILGTEFGDGIWRSVDQAASWTVAESLGNANSVTGLAMTSNPAIMYAALYGTGVYKSTNGGSRWHLTDTTTINHFLRAVLVHPANPQVVYAGSGNGVFRTVDGGASWSSVGVGMAANTSIRCMTMDPMNPSVIYCGTDSSYLYRTTNGGSIWTHITSANGFLPQDIFIRCVTVDRQNSAVVFAGSDSGRIYRSTTTGASWSLLSTIATVNSVRSIVQHPTAAGVLFAATFGSGVHISSDGGTTWAPMNAGLPDAEIYTLEADGTDPLMLYAGTGAHGVVRFPYAAGTTTITDPVNEGWNLVSVPVTASDMRKNTLFPGATTSAFSYDGTYTPHDTLVPGRGYWLKFPAPDTVGLTGSALTADTVAVAAGWNLVGSISAAIPVSAVAAVPPAAIASPFYSFAAGSGYAEAATLIPGKACWVKISQAGQLIISPPGLP